MKYRLILVLAVLSSNALAQGSSNGAAFLKNPIHARTAALGDAVLADPGILGSATLNPANLLSTATEVSASHVQWVQDIQTQHLSLESPFAYGSLGLSLHTAGIGGIEVRDVPGPPIGTFAARGTSFQGMVAAPITGTISVGLGVKYLYEKIYVDEHSGFGVDAGVLYTPPIEGLIVGAALTNFGSMGAARTTRDELPRQLSAGASYRTQLSGLDWRGYASFAAGQSPDPSHVRLGLDVRYEQLVSARVGYQTGYDARGLTFGLGITYSVFTLDYAWVPFSSDLGNANILSIGLRFDAK